MVGWDKRWTQDGGAEVEQDHSLLHVMAEEGVDVVLPPSLFRTPYCELALHHSTNTIDGNSILTTFHRPVDHGPWVSTRYIAIMGARAEASQPARADAAKAALAEFCCIPSLHGLWRRHRRER